MSRRINRIVVFVAVAAAACSSPMVDETGLPQGAFVLEKVNGLPIPYPMVDNGAVRVDVVTRSVELRSDGRFADRMALLVSDAAGTSPLDTDRAGSFIVDGGALVLTYDDTGRTATATVSGRFLELDDRGVHFLLQR